MPGRRPLEERIEIVCLYARLQNCSAVRREWSQHFATPPPDSETIQAVYDRFRETGSVTDRDRTGRPQTATTEEKEGSARELVRDNPSTSVREGAASLNISVRSYRRLLHQLDLRPYRAQYVPPLSDGDLDRRVEFCEAMLQRFDDDVQLVDRIIWSDESLFRLDGTINRHNDVVWATTNPHRQVQVPNSQQSVMVWCGITSAGLIGPFFFEEYVTADSYLQLLQTVLWPAARHRGKTFQQDGAGPHYALSVRGWLDQKFPGRWIGRRGPIEWPPRSPDLTPCDFFLWGWLKERIYREPSASIAQLRERIQAACADLSTDLCKEVCRAVPHRFKLCCDRQGQHLLE